MNNGKFWLFLIGLIVIWIAWAVWNKPARSAPAEWYVVEWRPSGIRVTPQKTHDDCKALAAAKAREYAAACLSKAELDALNAKDKK